MSFRVDSASCDWFSILLQPFHLIFYSSHPSFHYPGPPYSLFDQHLMRFVQHHQASYLQSCPSPPLSISNTDPRPHHLITTSFNFYDSFLIFNKLKYKTISIHSYFISFISAQISFYYMIGQGFTVWCYYQRMFQCFIYFYMLSFSQESGCFYPQSWFFNFQEKQRLSGGLQNLPWIQTRYILRPVLRFCNNLQWKFIFIVTNPAFSASSFNYSSKKQYTHTPSFFLQKFYFNFLFPLLDRLSCPKSYLPQSLKNKKLPGFIESATFCMTNSCFQGAIADNTKIREFKSPSCGYGISSITRSQTVTFILGFSYSCFYISSSIR